jgi:hypothetical protein
MQVFSLGCVSTRLRLKASPPLAPLSLSPTQESTDSYPLFSISPLSPIHRWMCRLPTRAVERSPARATSVVAWVAGRSLARSAGVTVWGSRPSRPARWLGKPSSAGAWQWRLCEFVFLFDLVLCVNLLCANQSNSWRCCESNGLNYVCPMYMLWIDLHDFYKNNLWKTCVNWVKALMESNMLVELNMFFVKFNMFMLELE